MKNEKGLTLIEVLGAVVILSMIVLLLSNLTGYTRQGDQKSDKKAYATMKIEAMLSEIRYLIQQNPSEGYASSVVSSTAYNKTEGIYTSKAEMKPTLTPSFTKECNSGEQSVSMSSTVYVSNGTDDISQLVSITACWSEQQ